MTNSRNRSLPSLPPTATWGLTLLAICASSYVVNTWRLLVKENMNAPPLGRRPSASSANQSGLQIVFRRGSGITSSSGSPVPCDNSKVKREYTPSIAAGSSGLDRLSRHPVIQTLLSRLPQAGGPGPRAKSGQDPYTFSTAARKDSKSVAAACAIA
jgi:hypothetical protein